MDKQVIFAVAGAGKTTHIVNELNISSRSIVITYTKNNFENLQTEIIKKFGFIPKNIYLRTYFQFLFSFCFKPLLSEKFGIKNINWKTNPKRYCKKSDISNYYLDKKGWIYHNRIAEFLINQNTIPEIKKRISRYFDCMFIDEIQDIAGNDFEFLEAISDTPINMCFVGDFYQHTYDSSRDGSKNKSLHKDYDNYKKRFKKMGFILDTNSLSKSHRCSPTTCRFVTEKLGVGIFSHRNDETKIIEINTQEQANKILEDRHIVKLFFEEHFKFQCYSKNWGDSKGENLHQDICIVLNKTTLKKYSNNDLATLAPLTKNKLYVALTRARNDIYLLSYQFLNANKKNNRFS